MKCPAITAIEDLLARAREQHGESLIVYGAEHALEVVRELECEASAEAEMLRELRARREQHWTETLDPQVQLTIVRLEEEVRTLRATACRHLGADCRGALLVCPECGGDRYIRGCDGCPIAPPEETDACTALVCPPCPHCGRTGEGGAL